MAVKKDKFYIVIIIVLAAAVVYLFSQSTLTTASQETAVNNVKNVYGILTENPVEIINVKEESGLYKVLVRTTSLLTGQSNVQEVFVTKDGNLIMSSVINATGYAEALTREKNFAECLASQRVAVVGVSNDANTVAQLQALSPNFWYKFYIDCSGANLQLCQQANITQVPVIIFGNLNQSVVGVQSLSIVQQASGCTF